MLRSQDIYAYASEPHTQPCKFLCKGIQKVFVLDSKGDWQLGWEGVAPVYILPDKTYRVYKRGVSEDVYTSKGAHFAIRYLGSGNKDADGKYLNEGKMELYSDKGELLCTELGLPWVPSNKTEDTAWMVLPLSSCLKHIYPKDTWKRPEYIMTPTLTWVDEFEKV